MNSSSTMWMFLGVGVAVLILLLLAGPAEQTATAPGSTTPLPTASVAGESASRVIGAATADAGPDRTVGERETIELFGRGAVPGGGAVTYLWTDGGGLGYFQNAHSATATYTAPSACGCEECVVLTLTVTGANGVSARDSMVLTVRDPLACPVETCEVGGSFVTRVDPCRYVGAEATCPARPSEPCASPCITDAPSVADCAEEPVPCPCAVDGCVGGWAAGWPFGPQPKHARDRPKPRIDRQYPPAIREGTSVQITGAISNPACVSVCFTWSASKGWIEGADTLQPVYHAPESDRRDGETVTITLAAYDAGGGRSYDQIRMQIVNTDT